MAGKDRAALKRAFSEVKSNPPRALAKTRKKKGSAPARKQAIAIALSKARRAGASVPYSDVRKP